MSDLIIPRTLTAGQPENVTHVQENFDAIRSYINGANIDGDQLSAAAGILGSQLADLTISAGKLAPGAIGSADKIADAIITLAKLNLDIRFGSFDAAGNAGGGSDFTSARLGLGSFEIIWATAWVSSPLIFVYCRGTVIQPGPYVADVHSYVEGTRKHQMAITRVGAGAGDPSHTSVLAINRNRP